MPGTETSGDESARAPGLQEVLVARGFQSFATFLARASISARSGSDNGIKKFLSIEMRSLGASRALTETAHPHRSSGSQLPEFGRILVHLANGRTAHSHMQSSMQLLVFAFAFIRLVPPSLAIPSHAFIAQLFLVLVGITVCLIGLKQYFDLVRLLEGTCSGSSSRLSKGFEPSIAVAWIFFAMMTCVTVLCVYNIVAAELDIRTF